MEGNLTTMVKLNKSNWAMWMSMMENFLTIKDLSDILEGEKARPKDISDLEWNKMKKKMQLLTLGNGSIYPHVIIWQMKQMSIIFRRNWS